MHWPATYGYTQVHTTNSIFHAANLACVCLNPALKVHARGWVLSGRSDLEQVIVILNTKRGIEQHQALMAAPAGPKSGLDDIHVLFLQLPHFLALVVEVNVKEQATCRLL
jgi:hypothetical protein